MNRSHAATSTSSPSGEVLPPPNPSCTHGRTGRATVTAGTLSPVGDDVAGEDVKRYVEGRDADRDDANVMHDDKTTTDERTSTDFPGQPFGPGDTITCAPAVREDWSEDGARREIERLARLRRWQTIR